MLQDIDLPNICATGYWPCWFPNLPWLLPWGIFWKWQNSSQNSSSKSSKSLSIISILRRRPLKIIKIILTVIKIVIIAIKIIKKLVNHDGIEVPTPEDLCRHLFLTFVNQPTASQQVDDHDDDGDDDDDDGDDDDDDDDDDNIVNIIFPHLCQSTHSFTTGCHGWSWWSWDHDDGW